MSEPSSPVSVVLSGSFRSNDAIEMMKFTFIQSVNPLKWLFRVELMDLSCKLIDNLTAISRKLCALSSEPAALQIGVMMEGAAGHLGENGAMNNNEPSVSFPKEEEPDVSSSTAGVERGANDASAMLEAALQAGGILSSSSDMDYDPTTSTSLSLNGYTPSSSFLPTEFGAPMVTSSSAPSYHTVVSTDSNNQTVLFSTSQFTTSNNHFVGTSSSGTTSMIPTTTVKTSTVQSSMMSQLKTVPIPPPRASKNGPNNNRYHVASKSSESVFVVKPKAMSSASLVDMYAKVSMDLADRAQASPQLAVGRKSSAYTLNSYVKMSTAPLVPRKAEKKRKPTPPTEGTTNGEVPDKQAPPTATPVPAKKKKEQPRKYACDVCGKAFTRSSHVDKNFSPSSIMSISLPNKLSTLHPLHHTPSEARSRRPADYRGCHGKRDF
ncbi:unnamed protein product [Cyprideis torosa]|uniref:Uncharacterized protein n=1 Tax=Cyprideis torosa TaxID=163714 RepID=A0A7R8WK09_9CRUS|nr:unnamed protein product [Cyprideis torosa]CAG0896574.1 unnamed protein product [Cyprideis torosa]